jgi:hypothetical protein
MKTPGEVADSESEAGQSANSVMEGSVTARIP